MMGDYLGPYLLGPNDENQGIYTGDTCDLYLGLPGRAGDSGAFDLMYADPPWNTPGLIGLAMDIASLSLKLGGHLLLQPGLENMPYILRRMDTYGNLSYRSILAIHHQGNIHRSWTNHLFEWWQPLIWFSLGSPKWANRNLIANLVKDGRSKQNHDWEQGYEAPYYYIRELTNKGDIIFDPFTGGGTVPAVCKMLGRRWLAFEIDPATAERARERVQMTQAPLFTLEPEQMEMGL